ncbi:hypothetical protein J2S43_001432 [Catenuloplanes nepalensis]|uniref:ISAs1 family transposase n=1 Tax=Catenuloplanes nepalensis TaxID=587533 RepID=A0ABT9MNC0_9ACTN|nr:hypothetical protein [Catenuloplanes nepalensis]
MDVLAAVPDPRDPRGIRYPLTSLLAVAVCAVLAGASSLAAITDWLHDLDETGQGRLGFTGGIPAGATAWRLLTRLGDDLLSIILARWLHARTPLPAARPARYRTVISVDGKTLRGAHHHGRQVHLLSALDTSTGIVLAQITVEAKSNEIPAFTPLLDAVERVLGTPAGVLFTADAMHTQTGHADEVHRRGAHLQAYGACGVPGDQGRVAAFARVVDRAVAARALLVDAPARPTMASFAEARRCQRVAPIRRS